MRLSSWSFYWSEAGRNISRNAVLALASVSSTAVSLLVFGLFIALSMNVAAVTSALEGQVGIQAFISDQVGATALQTMEKEIASWPNVKSVSYIPKGTALKNLVKDFGSQGNFFTPLSKDNPLLNAFFVKAKSPDEVPAVANHLKRLSGVSNVSYQAPVVDRLFKLVTVVRLVGLGIGILLALGTLLIIQNAIRLGIFARRREIQIMRLVGATDGFIHWPFLLEGMIFGVLGGAVSAAIIAGVYRLYTHVIRTSLPFIPSVAESQIDHLVVPAVVLFGLLLGYLGSHLSLRRVRV